MINFDAVDFSERRSEEVISFFWRSVYYRSCAIWMSYIIIYNPTSVIQPSQGWHPSRYMRYGNYAHTQQIQ